MIKNIIINGTSINIPGIRTISALSGGSSPGIEVDSYALGGGEGVALTKTAYLNLVVSFSVTLTATDQAQLVQQKQQLLTLLSVDPTSSNLHQFTFVLINDQHLTAQGVVTDIDQKFAAGELYHLTLNIRLQTARAYLAGSSQTVSLGVADLGGMQIPMSIPMAMNISASDQLYSQLNNLGNAYSHLTATITGPCQGFILLNQTRQLRLQADLELVENDVLVLDFYQHTAILNQNQNVLHTISGNWWSIAPGLNSVLFAANQATPLTQAQLEFSSAYLGI